MALLERSRATHVQTREELSRQGLHPLKGDELVPP
jgi:hypothetical protein